MKQQTQKGSMFLNTWKEVKLLVKYAIKPNNMLLTEENCDDFMRINSESDVSEQVEKIMQELEESNFNHLKVWFSEKKPYFNDEKWKDFFFDIIDDMHTGENVNYDIKLHVFVYLPALNSSLIIYSCPYDFFDDKKEEKS